MLPIATIGSETIDNNRQPVKSGSSQSLENLRGHFDVSGPVSSWETVREVLSTMLEKIPESFRDKASFRIHGQYPDPIMVSVAYERRETDEEVVSRLGKPL
jgi:hypothetical protein